MLNTIWASLNNKCFFSVSLSHAISETYLYYKKVFIVYLELELFCFFRATGTHMEVLSNRSGHPSNRSLGTLQFEFCIIFPFTSQFFFFDFFQAFQNINSFSSRGIYKNRQWAEFDLWSVVCWPFMIHPLGMDTSLLKQNEGSGNFLVAQWVKDKDLRCHCSGLGHCYDAGLIPGLGTSTRRGCSQICPPPKKNEGSVNKKGRKRLLGSN